MSIQAIAYVIEHCEAEGSDRCMMFAIANHCNERGENCWASVATLAHEARLKTRSAKYALKRLREVGEVEPYGRSPVGTNFYRIPALADRGDQLPILAQTEGGANSALVHGIAPGGASSGTSGVQGDAPKPLGTVSRTTPPNPPRGEPRSRRKRDQVHLEEEKAEWISKHFPGHDPRAVSAAMSWAEKRSGEVTIATVEAELTRSQAKAA